MTASLPTSIPVALRARSVPAQVLGNTALLASFGKAPEELELKPIPDDETPYIITKEPEPISLAQLKVYHEQEEEENGYSNIIKMFSVCRLFPHA